MSDQAPAFPPAICVSATGDVYHGYDGMTLRDWFAGQALASTPLRNWDANNRDGGEIVKMWATCAYATADAMLAARKDSPHG